ncbi:MAG: PAS domain S-box protein, partial [Calditrichia bacterium]|nr:PAS domain S-box protein [Calditrichia bacterium]
FASDNPINEEGFKKTVKAIETGKLQPPYELELVHKSGKKVRVEVREAPIVENGKTVSIVGALTDITDRKLTEEALRKTEEKFRNLVQNMAEGIGIVDLKERFVYANPAAEKIFGVGQGELVGSSLFEFVDDETAVFLKNQTKLRQKDETSRYDFAFTRNDKTKRYLSLTASPQIDENGKTMSTLGIFYDITERKQAEEELKKYSEQLHALSTHLQSVREDERATIAREIHDELGQGLTALKMDLSLMGREIEEEPDNLNTNDLLNEIKSMSGFIDKTIQKVRKIITELRPEVLDSLGLIAALEWLCEEFQIHSGIICNFHTTYKEINSDNKQSIAIYRIVQEALTNIARHAKAASANVKIKKDKNNTIVEISDNGIGFSKAANKSKKTFGLLGMKERAIVFGGEVKIISVKNKGTTVKLKIPLKNTARSKHD